MYRQINARDANGCPMGKNSCFSFENFVFFIFDETILFFKTDCGYCATTRVTTAWTCAPITCAPLTCSSGLVPQYSYDTNGCRRGF